MAELNWNDLPLFLAIAEHGSLAGAACALGVNHSTVFRRLQALEAGLDVALFERHAGGYRLTEAGAGALPDAELARDAVDRLLRRTQGLDAKLSGPVRVTTAPDLAQQYLPEVLARLRIREPGIRVEVIVANTDHDLARREADLALRATSAPPEGLVGRRLCEVDWAFYGQPGTDPDAAPLLAPAGDLLRVMAYQTLLSGHSQDRFVASAGSLDVLAALAAHGVGVALLPSNFRTEALVRLADFEAASPSPLWLLFHPDLRSVARVRALGDVIAEVVQEFCGAPLSSAL